MQHLKELKQNLGSNIGYTSLKIALGCGAAIAVSLITTQCYMKWKKKRKITRIIDTFEEFQNGRVHIKYPDQVEDKVLHFIKGGSSKLQIVADFDKFLLLPESYSELINKINGIRIKTASNGFGGDCDFLLPEEKYFTFKTEIEEEMMRYAHLNGYRKGCGTFFEIIQNHKLPLILFTEQEEVVRQFLSFTSIYPNVYPISSKDHKQTKDIVAKEYLQKRPNTIVLGNDCKSDWLANDSNSVLHIGFLENEIDIRLSKYLAKYDIVVTSESCLEVINVFLSRIV